MANQYNLKNIRTLLVSGFSESELRTFCFDESDFEDVYNQLSYGTGRYEIVQLLLDHAKRKSLIEHLLTWAKEHNPTMYEKYQPYQGITISPTTSSSIHEKSQRVLLTKFDNVFNTLQRPVKPFKWQIIGVVILIIFVIAFVAAMIEDWLIGRPLMAGSFRIAIAGFAQEGTTRDSETGVDLAQQVAEKFQQNLFEIKPYTDITVWGPNQVGNIKGENDEEQTASAEQIGKGIGADLVVYGFIDAANMTTLKFKLLTDRYGDSVVLDEIMSQPVITGPWPITDFVDRNHTVDKMTTSLEILSNVLLGFGDIYHCEPNYEKALRRFQAADISEWPNNQGKYLLYGRLGDAAFNSGDSTLAKTYYEKALQLNPEYANAYLGLANIRFESAMVQFQRTGKRADIDVGLLNQAIAIYEQAKKVALDSPSRDLAPYADYGLGRSYAMKLYTDYNEMDKQNDKKMAIEKLTAVILDYAGGERPRLQNFAAKAHHQLGWINQFDGNLHCALKEYEKAVLLLEECSSDRVKYEEIISSLRQEHADTTQCLE